MLALFHVERSCYAADEGAHHVAVHGTLATLRCSPVSWTGFSKLSTFVAALWGSRSDPLFQSQWLSRANVGHVEADVKAPPISVDAMRALEEYVVHGAEVGRPLLGRMLSLPNVLSDALLRSPRGCRASQFCKEVQDGAGFLETTASNTKETRAPLLI